MLLIKWECQYYPRRKYFLLFSPRWCLLVCGYALSARALLGLEEFGGAGSGMCWGCRVSLGVSCLWDWLCAAVTELLLEGLTCAGTISSLWAAQGSCQVFPQLPAGDGDLCYPAAFLFPVKLIISLALVCRMTIFTVQDSQYKQIVKNLGPSYHTHTALLIQKGCMSVKRIRTKPARSDGVGIAFLFLTACVYLWEKTDGSAWFYSPVCV